MSWLLRRVTTILIACAGAVAVTSAAAQSNPGDALAVGRQMLAEDNPGELWVERGKTLYYQKRGPRNASLEQCDLGLGAGVVKGVFARLPRYFAGAGSLDADYLRRSGAKRLWQRRGESNTGARLHRL